MFGLCWLQNWRLATPGVSTGLSPSHGCCSSSATATGPPLHSRYIVYMGCSQSLVHIPLGNTRRLQWLCLGNCVMADFVKILYFLIFRKCKISIRWIEVFWENY